MEGTRVQLLENIVQQVTAASVGAQEQLILLADVAGSGKTAIAHSIAEKCREMGSLASSFFFDRDIPERNGPEKLFSTIASDLARLSTNISAEIDRALEEDRSLASASLSRQFDELILKPFQRNPISGPVVVVIDALDESYDSEPNIELLEILRDRIPKLPDNFRIFITSRPLKEIDEYLDEQPHIFRRSIYLHEKANLDDIAIYARKELKGVTGRVWGRSRNNWPDEQLLQDFITTAEGLFLWVSTVCMYLRSTVNPDKELRSLISRKSPQKIPAEDQMDRLYLTILKSCNWDDDDFVVGYKLIVGAIMAAKDPLSIQALQALHSITESTEDTSPSEQSHVTVNATVSPPHESARNLDADISPRRRFPFSRVFRHFAIEPLRTVRSKAVSSSSLQSQQVVVCTTTEQNRNLTVQAIAVLRPLGALLTGLTVSETPQPVRIPHLSFRDFVTIRAELSSASKRFYLNKKEHNARLAYICLLILNKNLKRTIPGTGYLSEEESAVPRIPRIADDLIPEEVWYACRFWLDHIIDVECPIPPELIVALQDFVSTRIVLWTEIVAAKGKFRNLQGVRKWLQVLIVFDCCSLVYSKL